MYADRRDNRRAISARLNKQTVPYELQVNRRLGSVERQGRRGQEMKPESGMRADLPCIFSGSNGHVPPLIEDGCGVKLPREIRG